MQLTRTVYLSIELTDHDSIYVDSSSTEWRPEYKGPEGWIRLGTTQVEIAIPQLTPEQITAARISVLKTAIQKMDADHQVKRNAILDQISNLSALPFFNNNTEEPDDLQI
jgi:hypothetical protein